jgi:5-methyltetrahydropteroyltriglutamate--homocysteine methyltransferase
MPALFPTTHTGSLPRPEDLTHLLQDREDARPTPGIDARIQQAVKEVLQKERTSGLDIVNDGEMGKIGYSTYVTRRLTGFERSPEANAVRRGPVDLQEFPDYPSVRPTNQNVRYAFSTVCSGPISSRGTDEVQADLRTLKAAAQEVGATDLFMTAASPGVIAFFIPDRHYNKYEAYLSALAEAMRPEYRAIVDSGVLLQLDCPDLAMAGARFADVPSFRKFMELNVEALNHALQGLPPERLRVHLCWGNYEGPHNHDVDLKDIVDIVLKTHASGISIESSNPRHGHEWRVWEDVKLPDDRYLLPGVIDSVTNFVEHPDLVAERILNYASVVGAERVVPSTDCGFGTFAGMTQVAPSIVWAKFQSMAEGARRARERIGAAVPA